MGVQGEFDSSVGVQSAVLWLNAAYLLPQILDNTIVTKGEIEELFKKGIIRYLVCTSTLIEGVNLPAQTIFIRGINKGKKIQLSEMDFWNLAGRAGRQGKEFQGNIVCIDSDDETAWKGLPPRNKTRYIIISSAEKIITEHTDELVAFIASKENEIFSKPDFAHTLSYLLNEKAKSPELLKSSLALKYGTTQIEKIDKAINELLKGTSITIELLAKNIGIHPSAQLRLYKFFNAIDIRQLESLMPVEPATKNAYSAYLNIVQLIAKYLTNEPTAVCEYHTIITLHWMRGYGLARIIADCIQKSPQKKLSTVIRDTMRDIEQYARFSFLKHISCYNSILAYNMVVRERSDLARRIPDMNLWLEFGASMQTQISLMGLGLSRNTAIQLTEKYITNEDMNVKQCVQWLLDSQIRTFDFNEISIREIEKIVERHKKVGS
jgi:hypothetical protein